MLPIIVEIPRQSSVLPTPNVQDIAAITKISPAPIAVLFESKNIKEITPVKRIRAKKWLAASCLSMYVPRKK
jgi:hypothetical protein